MWVTKAFCKRYSKALILINNILGLDNDIDHLLFNQLQTYPSTSISKLTDTLLVQLGNEIKECKMEFNSAIENADNEITKLWLRKSHELVLVVVAVQKKGHLKRKFYGGCNMQVSMPTGSVYGMKDLNKSKIRGSCSEWLGKIAVVNTSLKIVTFTDLTMIRVFVCSLK